MGKSIIHNKKLTALIVTVIVFVVISVFHLLGVFHYLEYKSYDLRVRLTAEYTRPSDDIILILLRQDCLDWALRERGWGWPWPRQAYAEILDYMSLGGAKSVAFDIIFSEPSIYRNARQDEIIDNAVRNLESAQSAAAEGQPRAMGPLFRNIVDSLHSLGAREDDASFARAMERNGRVVQTIFFSSQTGNAHTWPAGLNSPLFRPENFGSLLDHFDIGEGTGAQFPIPELRNAAAVLGSVTGKPDSDGIIRRLKPFTLFDGKAVPEFSLASLMVSGMGQGISYDSKKSSLEWGEFSIPVDKNGNTLLRYRGDLSRFVFYNASDILQSAEAFNRGRQPLLSPENFVDAHIFVGLYAPGLFDIFSTPISTLYPGIGCHITMLDNLLQGDFIRESSLALNLIILLAAIALTVLLTFSNRITFSVGGIVLFTFVIIAFSFGVYHWGGLWLPIITFLAGILSAFITVTLYNYATEGSQKRFIKSAFSQYLSPKVVDQIILDPSQLKLGGEKREMTAIFTDVRSFSTISEALGDPEKLVGLLNFYLTRMSNIVLDNQGTIDKYEGDAIIAFFGAPVHMDNHASLACRAVINMKRAETEINREALAQGLITRSVMEVLAAKGIIKSSDDPCPLFTRLGVNTGDMVVGNMGTPNKMDYTIMGNAVNLAARLEGVNKQYYTGGILISEYTRKHIGDEFVLRPLSRVRVVGVNTPLRLYELLDSAADAPPELLEMVKSWEQGFALYENRDFLAAQKIFQAVYQENSADLTAKMYLQRCGKYLASPPDEASWDNGVDNLTEK
jgi:class 3 adenylate cyclase/CHASE2 domain-containing sensor protein